MKTTVKFAESSKLIPYAKELTQLWTLFGVDTSKPSLTTDYTTLSMVVGSHFNLINMDKSYRENVSLKLFLGFGCTIPESLYDQPLPELCKFIKENQTLTPTEKVAVPWLGIDEVFLGEEKVSANWICLLTENVLYRKGYAHTYKDPNFLNDVQEEESDVFNGDRVTFRLTNGTEVEMSSVFEAYCFLIAQVSNYKSTSENLQ